MADEYKHEDIEYEYLKLRRNAYSLICGALAVGYRDQSLLQLTANDLSYKGQRGET